MNVARKSGSSVLEERFQNSFETSRLQFELSFWISERKMQKPQKLKFGDSTRHGKPDRVYLDQFGRND